MADGPYDDRPRRASDAKYLTAVGVLMGLIIVSLAGLWLAERGRRIRAEKQLAGADRQIDALKAALGSAATRQLAAAGLPGGAETAPAVALPLEDILAKGPIKWQGEDRTLVRITAAAGRRLGLNPGDLIDVARAPSTAPSGGGGG